jgi:tetratricopeptide repeat protein/HEAT repeat protein/doubled CXXCH motif protein/cytochrome c554/c'-like protein
MPRFLVAVVGLSLAWVAAALNAQAPDRRDPHGPAGRDPERVALQPPSAASAGDPYTGSESCQRCHEAEYDSWKSTLHVQMTRPIGEAHVAGDFKAGTRLDAADRTYSMENRNGRYYVSVARTGAAPEKFEVHYTLGARRFQGYLSRLPDGRIYVLPVFWHNESKRWLDYRTITPVPDDPSHDFRQIWNVTCVNCHATNLVRNYDVRTDTFATRWTEMGIGCEACHGPGREHIADPEHLKIFSMKKVPPRQIFDACSYCHGNKNNVFFGFKAGDRYEDYALPFLISEPIPANDPQGDFWPDGRPSRFNRPQALTLTGCFQRGEATCTSCHRMHGAENNHSLKVPVDAPGGGHTRESDTLCTQCHTGAGGADQHTHHAPESQGSRCINCHMSDVNWRLITRRLDHTFQPPVPELTARYGVPNACTTCHEEKSPEWAAQKMDEWYGDGDRRRAAVALSDTMYAAGTGDATVLPKVAALAVDRSHGALVRASAAEFAGQLIVKELTVHRSSPSVQPSDGARGVGAAITNALIGAASDSEPMVRATAVRSLGLMSDVKLVPILVAHLVDSARVVRVRAAEALLNLSIETLDGPAGDALRAAQDEWIDGLRSFEDAAYNHVTLARLLAARGQTADAARELTTAARLDPSDARPFVSLGVMSARAGRYEEAARHFRKAKSLSPGYPNIDRLIEEAERRRQ